MITQIVIAEDTLSFFVDTGADASVISPEFADRLVGRDKTTDIWGITKKLPTTRIGEVKWGDMLINNMVFAVAPIPLGYAGIIGGDLLRNYSFTIDNQREKFIISTESRNIANSNIIAIPFSRVERNRFFVFADWLDNHGHKILNNQIHDSLLINRKGAFLFDTGFTAEFAINQETFESLDHSKQRRWNQSVGGMFDRLPNPADFTSHFLSDLQVGNTVFSNVLVRYSNVPYPNNIMGVVFMRRFQSITIDYPRQNIYFELPNNYEQFGFSFSSGSVDIAPLAHWDLFFTKINSLGIVTSGRDSILVVEAILEDKLYSSSLNKGDTIVGVNNILFTEKAFRLSIYNDDTFYLDTAVCKRQIRSQIFLSDRVDLHFVKDDSLRTVALHRDTFSGHTPMISYSFGTILGVQYFVMNHPRNDQFTYNKHLLPWSTLIGREKEFVNSWGDGREVVNTNVLPINENVSIHRGKRNSEITYSDWQMQLLMRMFSEQK